MDASGLQSDSRARSDAQAWVQLSEAGSARVRWVPLERKSVIVGRHPQCDLRLPSGSVSRRHAELRRDSSGRWWLRDLGSRNGTQVNGKPAEAQALRSGDAVIIGEFTLTFTANGRSADPSTTIEGTMLVEDSSAQQVQTMREPEATRLSMRHLISLSELGGQLQEIDSADRRRLALCEAVVSGDLGASAAAVLRVPIQAGQPANAAEVVCGPVSSGGKASELGHISRSLLRAVHESDVPAIASTATETHPEVMEVSIIAGDQIYSVLACPLERDDGALTVLYVTLPPGEGTEQWLAIGALAAHQFRQAGLVVHARQEAQERAAVERDLTRAKAIQHGLVPEAPSVPGLDLAIGFRPCRWIGGDYVDAMTTPDGQALLAIADVTGKGLPAALIMAALHAITRTVSRVSSSLSTLAETLNDHLCEHLDARTFVTMTLMLIDPETGRFERVNAGHPPAIEIDAQGQAHQLEDGMNKPFGIVRDPIVTQSGQLAPGHLLALYTDGLSELHDAGGQMLGIEGLAEELAGIARDGSDGSLTTLVSRVNDRLDELADGKADQDDRTFLLVRRG